MQFHLFVSAAAAMLASPALAQQLSAPIYDTPMMRGDTTATGNGYDFDVVLTVSERPFGYLAPGILDGVGVLDRPGNRGLVLVNHELNPGNGYAYTLANGTLLTGARVSSYLVRRTADGASRILAAGPAYDTIYDRSGVVVTDAAQVNETGNAIDGFARFCSSTEIEGGTFGFVDDIYLTGEETSKPFHPHGGSAWAIDVEGEDFWALPALGRGAWENFTPLSSGDEKTVALLLGDDSQSAPLYLYVGQKNAAGDGSFLDRNGLATGKVYAWRTDSGDLTPEEFNGLNSFRRGSFVEVTVQDAAQAGQAGYDAAGYADSDVLQAEADSLGCFSFSRPEDLATNPLDGTQAAFNSTGRGGLFPSDNWGTIYVVDVDFSDLSADLIIIHDADSLPTPDEGIRSPDNLDWADNGKIYVQEDRSTSPSSLFGGTTGIEASLWELNPITRATTRIGEIDRSVVLPVGSTDSGAGDIGNWESSGILDVTSVFGTAPGERLYILNVQAHGIRDGIIGDNPLLDEGGQLLFMSRIGE